MKKTLKYMLLLTTVVGIMAGCKRDDDYIKSTPSNFIANFDLRKLCCFQHQKKLNISYENLGTKTASLQRIS